MLTTSRDAVFTRQTGVEIAVDDVAGNIDQNLPALLNLSKGAVFTQ